MVGSQLCLTSDVDAVSRLYLIDQVVMGIHHCGVRRLTGGHVFGGLLDFDLNSR